MNKSPIIPNHLNPEDKFIVAVRMILKEHAIAIDSLQKENATLKERVEALEALNA